MKAAEILKKQISLSYSKSNVKFENELIGLDIKEYGRLYVKSNFEIHIVFTRPLYKDDEIIRLFFSPRITSPIMELYFNNKKFQAYSRAYKVPSLGDFERAMEYFLVFKKMHDALIEFDSYR